MTENPLPSAPSVPGVGTYTSRPVTITAVQWDGTAEHAAQLCDWADSYRGRGSTCYIPGQEDIPFGNTKDGGSARFSIKRPAHIRIGTLEGYMDLVEGAWLIKGTEDEFYPCKDSVFQAKYRPAEPAISEGADVQRLYATTDAAVWTDEFCKLNPGMDWGTMVGWFANAIETAKSIESEKHRG